MFINATSFHILHIVAFKMIIRLTLQNMRGWGTVNTPGSSSRALFSLFWLLAYLTTLSVLRNLHQTEPHDAKNCGMNWSWAMCKLFTVNSLTSWGETEKNHGQNIAFVSQVTHCTFQISTATAYLSRLVQTVPILTTFISMCYLHEQNMNLHDADYRTHLYGQRNHQLGSSFSNVGNVKFNSSFFLFCFWRDSPPVGQGLLIHEVSRSHTTTHHSQ